ncbi:MAG: CRISPR system precrRNA processing endoribonuclease RAMP protein Cas6 [Moraxella sp.]|nr:CRISPR system precrRNA processing endoribonuclease RAMP protein Cas6 [Moraxella sp.]
MNNLYQFPITRFAITFKAKTDIILPDYAESALRGIFGYALKNMACLTAKGHHGQCRCVPQECLYRMIFDPAGQSLTHRTQVQDVPPPFVIEAHSLPTHIKQGQTATFYMVLIGKMAHDEQTIIRLAWQQALAGGLNQAGKSKATVELIAFELCDAPHSHKPFLRDDLVLDLVTHTRIQHHGKILGAGNFCVKALFQTLLRRYLTVVQVYGSVPIDEQQISQLYQDIDNINGSHQLQSYPWSRYSNRQKQKIHQDGLIGKIELYNVSERLYYLLYLGQWLHVGKGGAFGLGQYKIR